MLDIFADFLGLVGVAAIVAAYFLIQTGRVTSGHLSYPLLNLVGAVFILASLAVHWNLPSFVIEVIWVGISLYGIGKILRARRRGPPPE